jgi:hypothetical protein
MRTVSIPVPSFFYSLVYGVLVLGPVCMYRYLLGILYSRIINFAEKRRWSVGIHHHSTSSTLQVECYQ